MLLAKIVELNERYAKVVTKFGVINTWIAPNRLEITKKLKIPLDYKSSISFTAACKKALYQ